MLILFVMHLAACIKPQSISVYLAGIRSFHVANGYCNPLLPGLRLIQTLLGIERKHFTSPKRKMPITFDLLCKIHPFVNFLSSNDIVFWSAITCGHFLLLRASEFTVNGNEPFDPSRHLTLSDVNSHQSPTGEHYWTVRLKQSKIDQQRRGNVVYVAYKPCRLPSLRNEV